MIHAHRYWICRMPTVAWYVGGRKLFAGQSPAIKRMWKVGDYRHVQAGRFTPRTEGGRP